MAFTSRISFLASIIMGVGVLGLVWFRIVSPHFIPMLAEGGQYHGPLSAPIMNLQTVVYAVLGLLLFGGFIWFIISTVREERSRQPNQRRPPR
jgi:uncharacterized BrkB/YihY/UPF0761 family membrane protein